MLLIAEAMLWLAGAMLWLAAPPSLASAPGTFRLAPGVRAIAASAGEEAFPGGGSVLPSISTVVPDRGPVTGGEQVTIDGTGFEGILDSCGGEGEVWFGTDPAEGFAIASPHVQVLSDSQLVATVPANYGGLVNVQFANRCGTTAIGSGDSFTYEYPADQCLAGRCTIDVGSESIGPVTHDADGLLNGIGFTGLTPTPRLRRLIDALSLRQWRTDVDDPSIPDENPLAYCNTCRRHTAISLDLTTDWVNWASNHAPQYADYPYADLATYGQFIYNDVLSRRLAGQTFAYYDPWNEPVTGSIDAWLGVYGTAYDMIERADPGARVVGPSVGTFLDVSPGLPSTYGYMLDLPDFLDWEVASGRRFAAVSWHEDGSSVLSLPPQLGAIGPPQPVPGDLRDAWSPAAIGDHIREARALMSRYPQLQGTKVFVNEYGPPWAINIPGWIVGDVAEIEAARADEAMMTCATDTACATLLDGLIGWDGHPQMPYWVMRAYGSMRGSRLRSTTAASNLYVLATRVPRSDATEILLGRADDCYTDAQCPQFQASTAPAVRLAVRISVAKGVHRVIVSTETFPDDARRPIGDNDSAAPRVRRRTERVSRGRVEVALSSFGDGAAAYLTVTPAGSHRARGR